jgi:hypothetical protein
MRFLAAGVLIIVQAVAYELIRRRRFARWYEEAETSPVPETVSG